MIFSLQRNTGKRKEPACGSVYCRASAHGPSCNRELWTGSGEAAEQTAWGISGGRQHGINGGSAPPVQYGCKSP